MQVSAFGHRQNERPHQIGYTALMSAHRLEVTVRQGITRMSGVPTYSQHESHVNAERPDVRSCLAGHPEHREMTLFIIFHKLALVYCTYPKLPLDCAHHRRPLQNRNGCWHARSQLRIKQVIKMRQYNSIPGRGRL